MESQSQITTISADENNDKNNQCSSFERSFQTWRGLYQHIRSGMGISTHISLGKQRELLDKEDVVNLEEIQK